MSVCQSPTPGVYTCQTCNALFTCLEYYQQHRRNHAECNGIKLLTCSHCPYSTDNSFHYNWHIMSHTNKPAHRCQVCIKPQPPPVTSAPAQLKQEPFHNVSDSISDEEPSSCAMTGKRSVATATTDDLLLSSNLQSTPQQTQPQQQQQQQPPQQQSSCRMKSTGIMTSFSDHSNNFYNLKTIDASDLMDNKYSNSSGDDDEEEEDEEEEEEEEEDEEEEEGEDEEEEEEEVYPNIQKNGDNESEAEDEEEEDDEDEEEEEEEEEQSEEFGVSVETSVQNNSSNNTNNIIINNNITNITNNNNTNNSNKRVKTSEQTGTDGNTKPRGRGKGNRKSRVNVFFDGADGSIPGVEGIRRKFHCSHCGNGKSFKTKSHLQRHILTHTGEKPYHCNRCGSKFNQSSSLRNHIIAIHTKEYPHYCPNCGKGFLMPALLQKHLATSHRNK